MGNVLNIQGCCTFEVLKRDAAFFSATLRASMVASLNVSYPARLLLRNFWRWLLIWSLVRVSGALSTVATMVS